MNAPANRTTGTQDIPTIREKTETRATDKGRNKFAVVYQELSKFKEDIAMKLSMIMTKDTPAKVLGGLAIGALLLAATALPQGTVQAVTSAELVTLAEEFYHPITGEGNIGPAASVTLGALSEEFYHPITGERNVGLAASVALGEKWYHPITGQPVAPIPSLGS